MNKFKNLINGKLYDSPTEMQVIHPRDESVAGIVYDATREQTEQALNAAQEAAKTYSRSSVMQRKAIIEAIREVMMANKDRVAELIHLENGNLLAGTQNEVPYGTSLFEYFIDEAKRFAGPTLPDYNNEYFHYLKYTPVGVVVSYLPYNHPIVDFCMKISVALATGNCIIFKPSKSTPLSAAFVGELFSKMDIIPPGVVQILCGNRDSVGKYLAESTIPRLLTLVGSNTAGQNLVKASSSSVKKYSLELGGNAPIICFEDADPVPVAKLVVSRKVPHAAQNCIAPNRVFIHEKHYDKFLETCVEELKQYRMPDGDETGKVITPLVSKGAVERMVELIADAKEKGGEVVFGGERAGDKGYFLKPTLIKNCHKDMRVFKEEIFGPIIAVKSFSSDEDIYAEANDTEFGLACVVFTHSLERAFEATERLDFGSVHINMYSWNENLPHGGIRQSGYGKGLGTLALVDYYDVKKCSFKKTWKDNG